MTRHDKGCSWDLKKQVRTKMADDITLAQELSQLCPVRGAEELH